jgi:hypothetical protein
MRMFVVAALCCALAGCFEADGPLFPEARGACPFDTPSQWITVDPKDRSEPEPGEQIIQFETDGAFCKISGQGITEERVLFVPISHGWYILQDESGAQTYSLMRVTRTAMKNYLPACSDFNAARLRRAGIAFDDERDRCKATTPEQIETLFREWRSPFRRASSEMRRVD